MFNLRAIQVGFLGIAAFATWGKKHSGAGALGSYCSKTASSEVTGFLLTFICTFCVVAAEKWARWSIDIILTG
jgi:hypothetical protein